MLALFRRIKAIIPFLKDKDAPKRKKALVIFGIVYLFLPVDIIPPFFFPIGFVDDLIIWVYILSHLGPELDEYISTGSKKGDTAKKFRDKDIVEGVQFEVEDDSADSDNDNYEE